VKHRGALALLALLGALAVGSLANVFEDEDNPQSWVPFVSYLIMALLGLFVLLVLSGLAALVRRTFHDTRHSSFR
jgi:uncharacterized membrane protein YhaH (DUF805 family)